VGQSYNNIGLVYFEQGEYEQAINCYTKTLQIRIQDFGETNPEVANCYSNIGVAYSKLENYDAAIEYHKKALEIRLIKDSVEAAKSYNSIGVCYSRKKAYNEAIESFKKAKEIYCDKLGKDHPMLSTMYNNIGNAYLDKGWYDDALKYFKKSLEIKLNESNRDFIAIAYIYNDIGSTYLAKGLCDEAIEYYKKALDLIEKKAKSASDMDKIITYNHLSKAYFEKGQYDESLEYHKLIIEKEYSKFGEDHPQVAIIYNKIALIYYFTGHYTEGIDYSNKALKVFSKIAQENHPENAKSYIILGHIYKRKKDFQKSEENYMTAQKILGQIYSGNHPKVLQVKNFLTCLKKAQTKEFTQVPLSHPIDIVTHYKTFSCDEMENFSNKDFTNDHLGLFHCVAYALQTYDYVKNSSQKRNEMASSLRKLVARILEEQIELFDETRDLGRKPLNEYCEELLNNKLPPGYTELKALAHYFKVQFWVFQVIKFGNLVSPDVMNPRTNTDKRIILFLTKKNGDLGARFSLMVAKNKKDSQEVTIFRCKDKEIQGRAHYLVSNMIDKAD